MIDGVPLRAEVKSTDTLQHPGSTHSYGYADLLEDVGGELAAGEKTTRYADITGRDDPVGSERA